MYHPVRPSTVRAVIVGIACLATGAIFAQFLTPLSPLLAAQPIMAPAYNTQWVLVLHVGAPPKDFIGPMPFWQPSPTAPRIYYEGPSLAVFDPGAPPIPGTMTIVVAPTVAEPTVARDAALR